MAALSVFCTMMNPLGFINAVEEHIYTYQGIDLLEEAEFLTGEGISNLMKTVCKGGHGIPDPENLGQVMRAPGFLVSNLDEENFKLLAYYIRHGVRVSMTVTMPEITGVLVRSIAYLRYEEKYHVNPD